MRTTLFIAGIWILGAAIAVQAEEHVIPGVATSSEAIDFSDLDKPVQMMEQEFDPALLDALVPLSTAPAQVRLPATLIESGQWQGSQCGIGKSAHAVFRKQPDWEKFWNLAIKPYLSKQLNPPTIDFSKDMVVGVFRGEGGHAGDLIQIQSVKPDLGGVDAVLIVTYRNMSKMQPVFIPPFTVQPFHLKKVAAFPGRVSFRETKR